MDKEKFAQETSEGLPDGINPLYVRELLKKNVPDLLSWIQDNLHNIQPTLHETQSYARQYYILGNETYKDSLLLGVKILENNSALIAFVLKEIRSRTEAIYIAPE